MHVMNDDMQTPDSVFLAPSDFQVGEEGKRMCPRCKCCSVGVASYYPPVESQAGPITMMRFIPEKRSLQSNPSGNGEEAWFCYGGCDKKGKHAENRDRRGNRTAIPFARWPRKENTMTNARFWTGTASI